MHVSREKIDSVYIFLKQQKSEYFSNFEIKPCDICNGMGIKGYKKLGPSDYSWDMTYCEECKGFGYTKNDNTTLNYKNIPYDFSNYLCYKCFGKKCSFCNYSGIIDWVSIIMERNK